MKKTIRIFVNAALLCFLLFSCKQDAIFYHISIEPPKKDPLIKGTPTNIVLVGGNIFAGSRNGSTIYCYDGSGWSQIAKPGGSLQDLATDGTDLYAIVYNGDIARGASMIKKYDTSAGTWDGSSSLEGYSIQTIYGAGGKIFAGAVRKSGNSCAILYLDGTNLVILKENTSLLTGAAEISGTGIFLAGGFAAEKNGVFLVNASFTDLSAPISGTEKVNIKGIIETGGKILAVSGDSTTSGRIFIYNTASEKFDPPTGAGLNFTGALSVWHQYDSSASVWKPALLLMGVHGTSKNNQGYREIVLNEDGTPPSSISIRAPGDNALSSVLEKAKYNAGIGQHPVHSILQVPPEIELSSATSEGTLPIFASTSINGLWSYRNGEWNAED